MIEPLPRTVKPRKTGYTVYPVVITRRDAAMFDTGEIVPVSDINWHTLKPSLVVGVNLPRLVAALDRRYSHRSDWQWKATDRTLAESATAVRSRTIIEYFGFVDPQRKRHHYHRCLDAMTFYQNDQTLTAEQTDTLEGLATWAREITALCARNNLAIKPTASGLAAQFLRDPRFYPEPRRKVPRATNAAVRPALPGNHYQLSATTKIGERYQAVEVDQRRAHHYHAKHTPLPDANSLFAFGDCQNLQEVTYENRGGSHFFGLYYLQLRYRGYRPGRAAYIPEPFRTFKPGEIRSCFVWSNELPMLTATGFESLGFIAGWGSRNRDHGISAYSDFAQHELDANADANWLKPILLTTYGILAVNPRAPQAVYKQSDKGEPQSLIAGGREWLHGLLVSHTHGKKIEPGIANVLHRGLIESATRAETIGAARWLLRHRVRILQLYADSLIVEDDLAHPIPALPAPWRVKQPLTDFRPVNVQAFVSLQKSRLPGVSRADLPITSVGTFGKSPRQPSDIAPVVPIPDPSFLHPIPC